MATQRKPTLPTTEAIDAFVPPSTTYSRAMRSAARCASTSSGCSYHASTTRRSSNWRRSCRVRIGSRCTTPMHDAPWDADALNRYWLKLGQAHPYRGPHAGGVLIVDETGDPKRSHRIVLAAQQYLGKLGHVANGVVAVTSHWADGTRHVPLGVKPYRPASRLPKGRKDADFHTKPELAWQLIEVAAH